MNTAKLLLQDVQRVREGNEPHRHTDFARHMLRIPEGDFVVLCRMFPNLISKDAAERTAAWETFERSPFSYPYRVGKIVKGVIKNGVLKK